MSDKPDFVEMDLTEMMVNGVLMAANERFFWPFGLALTWDYDRETGTASRLHIREWHWADGHHEAIGLAPDDAVAAERRTRFQEWASARMTSMPEAERGLASSTAQPVLTAALNPEEARR